MFGLFYAIGLGVASAVSGTKCFIQNSMGLSEGIEKCKNGTNPTETYFDRKGVQRDIHTGQIAGTTVDHFSLCDDEWLYVGSHDNKVKNLSEERRAKEFELGKQGDWLGRTADIYDCRYWSTTLGNKNDAEIVGSFYKDLYNDKLYVCREFRVSYEYREGNLISGHTFKNIKYCKFYMDITNGKLVRKADTQIESERNIQNPWDRYLTDEEAEIFINDFNKQQDEGGWYQLNKEKTNNPLKAKQYFYCNEFDAFDHVRSLNYMHNN